LYADIDGQTGRMAVDRKTPVGLGPMENPKVWSTAIVDRLAKQEYVQGLILAGTELPLILREAVCDIPFLDTTQIHVKAAIRRLLSQ
jgi:aspartate/glutamate racemase